MKTTAPSHGKPGLHRASAAGLLTPLLAGAMLLPIDTTSAQTGGKPAKPNPPAAAASPSPAGSPAPKSDGKPSSGAQASRFIGPEALRAYVTSMSANFAMKTRATDPFGQPQDPNAKPVIKQDPIKKGPTQQPTGPSFADVVRLIKVTTVMPGEKRFLIGTRSIREGQKFPITYRGAKIDALVVSISSKRIVLRNVTTNETATLDLNSRPSGMTPGGAGIATPGMTRNSQDSPIDLDLENQNNQPPITP